jgi:hypothetical protein
VSKETEEARRREEATRERLRESEAEAGETLEEAEQLCAAPSQTARHPSAAGHGASAARARDQPAPAAEEVSSMFALAASIPTPLMSALVRVAVWFRAGVDEHASPSCSG